MQIQFFLLCWQSFKLSFGNGEGKTSVTPWEVCDYCGKFVFSQKILQCKRPVIKFSLTIIFEIIILFIFMILDFSEATSYEVNHNVLLYAVARIETIFLS